MKILIIGGVAGGASAAARARRLDDTAEIVVLERGEHPSFANCGLPYYVGGKIENRKKLLVAPAEMLRQRHRLDVRVKSMAFAIDRTNKSVEVKNLATGEVYSESYDKLIIATGASPIRPPLPGVDSPLILELRDLADADRMHSVVSAEATHGVIIGGGFIGIEVAENLRRRDIKTTLIERGDQILSPWDPEMVLPMEHHLIENGVDVRLKDSVIAFEHLAANDEQSREQVRIQLASGESITADFAVMSIGVSPENRLAKEAGLEIGERGGIVVDDKMQTSDQDIYAVGDVVQTQCAITGAATQVPLAGPANRQGRTAADQIFGRETRFRGVQGTSILGAFGKTVALTGLSEKSLRRMNIPFEKVYIHPVDHAGYYPGATQMTLKLLFSKEDGKVLGAQGVGTNGVDKRMDVLAMAIQGGMTVYDLEEVELSYAPQYGHAKDPVNMLGFVASGVLRGDQPVVHEDAVGEHSQRLVLDVRSREEFEAGHLPGAKNIPIEELRDRLEEIPKDQIITAYCRVGQRGYLATRVLQQAGYDVANLSGGYLLWANHYRENKPEVPQASLTLNS